MQMLFSYIGAHFLTLLESLLIQEEPAVLAMIIKEAQLIISKIEALIQSKSPAAAAAVNPVLDLVNKATADAATAAGNAVVQDAQKVA